MVKGKAKKPKPEVEIQRTTLMLPVDLWKKLKKHAIDVDREAQDLVTQAIQEYLKDKKP